MQSLAEERLKPTSADSQASIFHCIIYTCIGSNQRKIYQSGLKQEIVGTPSWDSEESFEGTVCRYEAGLRKPTRNTEEPRTNGSGKPQLHEAWKSRARNHGTRAQWELEPKRPATCQALSQMDRLELGSGNVKREGKERPQPLCPISGAFGWTQAEAGGQKCWGVECSPQKSTHPPSPLVTVKDKKVKNGWGGADTKEAWSWMKALFYDCFFSFEVFPKLTILFWHKNRREKFRNKTKGKSLLLQWIRDFFSWDNKNLKKQQRGYFNIIWNTTCI